MPSAKEIARLARETLGIERLRHGQLQGIEAVTGPQTQRPLRGHLSALAEFVPHPTNIVSPKFWVVGGQGTCD